MKCPLCLFKGDFFLKANKREYWLCGSCGLVFVPPRFFLAPEEEVERYLQHENNLENEGYVQMFQQKIEIIRKVCPDIRTVLDYGCGYQPVLKNLLEREGYAAEGYDPHFFPKGPSRPGYDLIISTETFEHFQEPGKELLRMVPRISPGGYLAVMTRWYPSLSQKEFSDWYYQRDPTHIAFYGEQTFAWIAQSFSLEIIYNNGKDFVVFRNSASPRVRHP